MAKDIIFWLDGPPICCKGIFDAVAKKWNGNTFYLCTKQIDQNRSLILGEDNASGYAHYVYVSDYENEAEFLASFLKAHLSDYHIFNGYKSGSSQYLKIILKHNSKANILIWAERPHPKFVGNKLVCFLLQIPEKMIHRYYASKYAKKVAALMPLGEKGIQSYEALGWPRSKMFPLLYVPEMIIPQQPQTNPSRDSVRMVYLGRFSSEGKGTDLLLEACKRVKGKNYSLDLVGGYGDYKNETLDYINENSHLSFGGTWRITDACENLSQYDICIVPSRMEGWNVTVNEAIMAGIGCIVTNEAVSDELVSASGAGIVVEPDCVDIASAMDSVMGNISLISQFHNAAVNYRERISADICADYFIDVILHVFEGVGGEPIPPWRGE